MKIMVKHAVYIAFNRRICLNNIIEKLKNYDEIYAIPMYPHYSSTTTKSSIEDFNGVT